MYASIFYLRLLLITVQTNDADPWCLSLLLLCPWLWYLASNITNACLVSCNSVTTKANCINLLQNRVFKSTHFHFKGLVMTSKINKWLMCYISVVKKEQIKNCYKRQLYFFNSYSFAFWLLFMQLPYSHDSVINELGNSIVYPGQVNKWGQNMVMAVTFCILCVLSQINRLNKCYSICTCATNIAFDS